MNRSELPPHKSATYVLPRWRVVYVAVPKAACTSLKWLMADLQGERPEGFYTAVSRETSRVMTIHHRGRWQHTPMLHDLPDASLSEIGPDNGWFVFGVVRHPSSRLFSAWESKFLLREQRFRDLYPDAPWPRIPQRTGDVVEDFTDFVSYLRDHPDARVFGDRHFRGQSSLLGIGTVPYSRVYRTSEMPALLADLRDHVRALGREDLPDLRRSNETPLRPVRAVFTDETCRVVREAYEQDFRSFGYDDAVPGGLEPADAYPQESLVEVGRLVDRAERVGDLYHLAKQSEAAERKARRQVVRLRRRVAALQSAHDTSSRRALPQRLTGRLERVPARARRYLRSLGPGPG